MKQSAPNPSMTFKQCLMFNVDSVGMLPSGMLGIAGGTYVLGALTETPLSDTSVLLLGWAAAIGYLVASVVLAVLFMLAYRLGVWTGTRSLVREGVSRAFPKGKSHHVPDEWQ